jgi:protein-S-isoprenylcysteine O-methyltransferase Ste14
MLIDHFELFGLRQAYRPLMGQPARDDDFVTPSLYRYVRHPLYVGWLVTLWATPSMSTGHLLFASACSAYVLVAVQLEERDLIRAFGRRYLAYRASTPMFLPRPRRAADGTRLAPVA